MVWALAFLPPRPCGTPNFSSPPSSHFLPGLEVSVGLAIVVFSFLALALAVHLLLQLGKSPTGPTGAKPKALGGLWAHQSAENLLEAPLCRDGPTAPAHASP